jgi:dynein heavy chain 1
MRKRSEKFIAVKINSAHVKLQERIAYLRVFRRNHEQLRAMTGPNGGLKGLGFDTYTDIDMDEEISQSYEGVKNAPVLDVSSGKDVVVKQSVSVAYQAWNV